MDQGAGAQEEQIFGQSVENDLQQRAHQRIFLQQEDAEQHIGHLADRRISQTFL